MEKEGQRTCSGNFMVDNMVGKEGDLKDGTKISSVRDR